MSDTYNYRRGKQPGVRYSESDKYGQLQPQDVEIEKAILGAMMIENEAFDSVCDRLRPEVFYDARHQVIYSAMEEIANGGKTIDIISVTTRLNELGKLEEAGGPFYITSLSGIVASSSHLAYHSQILLQKHLSRELIAYSSHILQNAFDDTMDVDDLMKDAESELGAISRQNVKREFTHINPVIKHAYEMLQKAAACTDGMSGVPSGFTELDQMTSGWQKSDLVIIAARPAMGKTAFVLSMAKNMAVKDNEDGTVTPVGIFSLEMSNLQLVNRLIVNSCQITGDKIRSGQLAPYEWQLLDTKIQTLFDAPLYVDDTPSLSILDFRTKARRMVRDKHVGCIIIDYLQLMNASGMKFGNRQEEVSMISRSLKGIAKELNIPIIALSQLNRSVEGREGIDGKRPQLSDLRESGAIEQDADMVIFLHRPEYYKIYRDEKGRDLRGLAEIIIAKHRNGAVGSLYLRFMSDYARFMNLSDAHSKQNDRPDIPEAINGPSDSDGTPF